jgi:serine/threonine protein kinase
MKTTDQMCMNCLDGTLIDSVCNECQRSEWELIEELAYQSKFQHALPPRTNLENRYLVKKPIGAGSFGITYLAYDLRLNCHVIIKECFPADICTRSDNGYVIINDTNEFERNVKSFNREKQCNAYLYKVKGIKEVASVEFDFEANHTSYFVMPFYNGYNMLDMLKNHKHLFSERRALDFANRLLSILKRIHEAGIVHLDLKPANLFWIESEERLILLDFGAAEWIDMELSDDDDYIYTEDYSFEIAFSSEIRNSPVRDVKAAAVMIFEWATGDLPKHFSDPQAELSKHLSHFQAYAIMRAMSDNPAQRYPSVEHFQKALAGKPLVELNRGDYVLFGKYNGNPIRWRVIDYDDEGSPLLFSDQVICCKAFDAAGDQYANHTWRIHCGSNRWKTSNLRQWLNSDEQHVNWQGNVPERVNLWYGVNEYHQEAGFLCEENFSPSALAFVKSSKQKVLVASVDQSIAEKGVVLHRYASNNPTDAHSNSDESFSMMVEDRMFCINLSQLAKLYQYEHTVTDEQYHYWLRDPVGNDESQVRVVKKDGTIGSFHANHDRIGVRPAFYLNCLAFVQKPTGSGSKTDPYQIES